MRRHRLLAFILLAGFAAVGADAQAAPTDKDRFPFALQGKLGGQGSSILEVLDVNRDGHDDLLFDRVKDDGVALQWRAGAGDGSFGKRRALHAWDSEAITRVEIADLDGQAGSDLLVGVRGTEEHSVEVLLRSGPPAVALTASLPTPSEHFAVADVTGDLVPDLAAAHAEGFSIREGNGDGTFGAEQAVPVTLPCEEGRGCLDPVLDLQGLAGGAFVPGGGDDLVARYDDGLAVMGGQLVLASRPDGGFEQGVFNRYDRGTLDFLLARDLDGDGFLDLIAGGSHGLTSPYLYALYGDESGSFESESRSGAAVLGPEPGILDADGDGDLDLVAPNGTSLTPGPFAYLETGERKFKVIRKGESNARQAGPVATGDFDEDGRPDFASTVFSKTPRLTVWLNSLRRSR